MNNEFADAALYARTRWETITLSQDTHITGDQLEAYISRGAFELARALLRLAQNSEMPAEEQRTSEWMQLC